jgi:hypothetical protein
MGYYGTTAAEFTHKGVRYTVSGSRTLGGDGGGDSMTVARVDGAPIPGTGSGPAGTTGLPKELERAAEKAVMRSSNYHGRYISHG